MDLPDNSDDFKQPKRKTRKRKAQAMETDESAPQQKIVFPPISVQNMSVCLFLFLDLFLHPLSRKM